MSTSGLGPYMHCYRFVSTDLCKFMRERGGGGGGGIEEEEEEEEEGDHGGGAQLAGLLSY